MPGQLPFVVHRIVCVIDCGVVINPLGIEQQVEGAVIWALSNMKSEITVRGGRVEQSSYLDFPVARMSETPVIETHIVPSHGDQPFGVGEPPVPPAVPAIVNALFAATGRREYGGTTLAVDSPGLLLRDLAAEEPVWMSHGDAVVRAPDGFHATSHTDSTPIASMEDPDRGLYAVQFHPEVVHTPRGAALLRNFTQSSAGVPADWNMKAFRAEAVRRIRERVGKGRVICGLSGGVDSAVAAVLIHEAIGDQLTCVFVDHGLMRLGEAEQVVSLFRNSYNIPLVHVDASADFLGGLEGVSDPEKKRKFIGAEFINVFEAEAKKIGGADFLARARSIRT